MMIPRTSAASVVAILESALDSLREAHALANAISDQKLTTQIEPVWTATAHTGGVLSAIYEAYPDLVGADAEGAGARDASIATEPFGAESFERIRGLLEKARGLLGQAAGLIDRAGGIPEVGVRFA